MSFLPVRLLSLRRFACSHCAYGGISSLYTEHVGGLAILHSPKCNKMYMNGNMRVCDVLQWTDDPSLTPYHHTHTYQQNNKVW